MIWYSVLVHRVSTTCPPHSALFSTLAAAAAVPMVSGRYPRALVSEAAGKGSCAFVGGGRWSVCARKVVLVPRLVRVRAVVLVVGFCLYVHVAAARWWWFYRRSGDGVEEV